MEKKLFSQDIADLRGVTRRTVHVDNARSRMARNNPDLPSVRKSYDMPPEDGYEGRSPWWWESTIIEWLNNRPGAVNQLHIESRKW